MNNDDIYYYDRDQLIIIAEAAVGAFLRADKELKETDGFPRGECAWAMADDLRQALVKVGLLDEQ